VQACSGKLAAVISPWSTVEEAWLLGQFLKQHRPDVTLAMGPVRLAGADDHYPKTVTGAPASQVKFTIRAEKAPNRRGVELVLQHLQDRVLHFDELSRRVEQGEFNGLFLLNADPRAEFADGFRAACAKLKLLIVQDLLSSQLTEAAHFVLAGAAWAEKDGTFVNHADLAQPIVRALRGPGDARPDGRILWDLCGRTGLFRAPTVRQEIASAVPSLAALILGDLGEQGVSLKSAPSPAAEKALQPA
jgi:NADH-quinone oxidoreductase subunit G